MSERYKRQIEIIGEDGQKKLHDSTVLIVGAGGLGNIAAKYLAAAGVGFIVIIDNDEVEISNLNRQVLFSDKSLSKKKAIALSQTLQKINQECFCLPSPFTLNNDNCGHYLDAFNPDIVLDCLDEYASSKILNIECFRRNIPVAYGKTSWMSGTYCLINSTKKLDLFFPVIGFNDRYIPKGVLGPLGGIIGSYQAMETIKYLTGRDVIDGVLFYDGNRNTIRLAEIS